MGWLAWLRAGTSGILSIRSDASEQDLRDSLLDARVLSMSGPSDTSGSIISQEQQYVLRRIRDNPMWTLDRGTGFYQQERLNKKKASLLGAGRNAGKSNVQYYGIEWTRILKHVWKRDFFTTAVHSRFPILVLAQVVVFVSSFLFWACVYYVIWQLDETCFLGFNSFLSAFLFSIETQNTIGYGSHAIGDCWLPAWLVGIQCIFAVLLEAVFIGIIFAKISHPKGRSRTILISECACIARRDGILKFMFRVADIRKRTAIAPKIHAVMYTWGLGHTTAEGEGIPVTVQPLPLHYLDATLLLPVVVEHTIDERSPLYGHTSESLEALGAEIVVTFDGQSELGDSFMTRQSYLPSEIHWGCVFVNIIQQAQAGCMQHSIDLSRFHDVEPQGSLTLMPPQRLSRAVVLGGARRVPWPRLGENTLLLADELVVTQAADGRWFVAVRVGDAYPSQMCSASVTMFIYRYNGSTAGEPGTAGMSTRTQTYIHQELPLTRHLWSSMAWPYNPHSQAAQHGQQQQQQQGPETVVAAVASTAAAAAAVTHAGGGVNVLLRYPVVVGHEIGPNSPLKDWITPEGMFKDADAEIVVVASATQYITSHLAMRSKVYSVLGSIRWGHSYAPCVVPPKRSPTGHALVDWSNFHDVIAVHPAARSKASSKRAAQHQVVQQYQQHFQQGLQHQHGAADAYVAQVEDVVEHSTGHQSARSHKQQQQQQRHHEHHHGPVMGVLQEQMALQAAAAAAASSVGTSQQRGLGSSSAAAAVAGNSTLQAVIVQGDSSSAAAQATAALPVCSQQQGADGLAKSVEQTLAHSVGFTDLLTVGELQASIHAQKKLERQRLQQLSARRHSQPTQQQSAFEALASAPELKDATAEDAGQLLATAGSSPARQEGPAVMAEAAAAAAEVGWFGGDGSADAVGPSAAVHLPSRLGSRGSSTTSSSRMERQRYHEEEEDHTLTMLPAHRQDSWVEKRSLAGVFDMFGAEADYDGEDAGAAAGTTGVPAAGTAGAELSQQVRQGSNEQQ